MRLLDQAAAQALRIVGRLLDGENAGWATILRSRNDSGLQVSWQGADGAAQVRFYSETELDQLRDGAPLARAITTGPVSARAGDRQELLRTLGQELDQLGLVVAEIIEGEGSFRVSGKIDGESAYRYYSKEELRTLSLKRRAKRQRPG